MAIETYMAWAGPLQNYPLSDYLYGDSGPWPKINTLIPELPPMVDRVPQSQLEDFRVNVVRHYRTMLGSGRVKIILKMLAGDRNLKPVSDRLFAEQLFFGLYSKLLTPVTTEDSAKFEDILADQSLTDSVGEPKYLKFDTLSMNRVDPLHGLYSAPALTLFRRDSNASGTALAIVINGLLLTPADKDAWELAKYFVLQGAVHLSSLLTHPRLHFPMDAISAISLTSLPKQHVLFKLIAPHTRIQLAINQAVSLLTYSVAHNNQFLPYTPFCGWGNIPIVQSGLGWTGHLTDAFSGVEGNATYPPYKYPLAPEKIWSELDGFLRGYYDVILAFVKGVVANLDRDDPVLVYWSNAVAAWVNGFPNHTKMKEGDTLARALTTFIWDVTVAHSADHGALGQCRQNIFPFRLRQPPPASKVIAPLNRKKLVKFSDTLRARLGFQMYFGPPQGPGLLHDTWYDFGEPALDALNRKFLQDLSTYDQSLTCQRFVSLKEIARSINF